MGKYGKSEFEEGIETIPSILEWVEKQDVSQMTRFFVQAPNVPMYLFASGGASSALHYAALLYESNKGMAKPLNPLMMASISDETLRNSKIFIFSTSGGGVDTRYALERALAAKAKEESKDAVPQKAKSKEEKEKVEKEKYNGLAVLSRDNDGDNYLIKTFIKKTGKENWFQYKWPSYQGFVSPVSGIAVMSLFYRAFTNKNDILSKLKVDLNPSSCFSYRPRKEGNIPPLKDIKTFITLYGGWSEPVAYNFENTMIEGGLANVQLSNYRNYGHGRFIYLSNHFEDSAFVLFVTPREKEFVDYFIINATFYEYGMKEVFPPNLPIIIVETEHDSPLATIDLVIKTKVLLGEIAKAHDENPCNPQNKMNIPKGSLINIGFKNLLEMGAIKGDVVQGVDGTLKGVNRKKTIIYDPKKSIEELAKKNKVKEPTILKYIREHNIDRKRDAKMNLYNKVWEEYVKDSERSKASIARTLEISENTLKLYLSMKTPPLETEEGKVGRVYESDVLSKLRSKLKDGQWDITLKFKDGRVVKETQETAIPEPTELQDSKPKETPTRKKKTSQEVRKSSDGLEGGVEVPIEIAAEASEGDIFLEPDMEVNGYKLYCCYTPMEAQAVRNTRWCYCNAEGMYRRYTKESGFLFVAAKKGYKQVKNPYKKDLEYRFKLYDEFATSLFSLTTFINPKTNEADVFSVTFRRNDTSRHYEGQHQGTYDKMMQKASELLGGFDIAKYCIEKTVARLGTIPKVEVVKAKTKRQKGKKSMAEAKRPSSLEEIKEELRKKLKSAKIKSLEELYEQRDAILKKEKERVAKCREVYAKAKPLTWDDFSFRKTHTYDTSEVDCWSFNSKTDERDGISLQLGNMANGFGVTILGREFVNSEVPYQLPIFKNDEASIAVQKEIADPSNIFFSNGLGMKRKYIYNKEYAPYRRDTDFELGTQLWCYEWMKWVVWEKVKQNKGFRDILLAIPKNAVIIEQAQKKSHVMWGCWNGELLKERKTIRLAYAVEKGISYNSPKAKNAEYQVNCASKWVGENAMGQILTMAKLALNEGVQMPIDAKMLNVAKICWFGDIMIFTEQQDGSVTVEARPSDTQDKPQDAIQMPLMPKRARFKVTVAEEIKPSQEAKESSDSRVHGIIGAVIGEVIGSRFEFSKPPTKKVDRFTTSSTFTDDTVLTVAVADALLHGRDYGESIFDWARRYPNAGFGRRFLKLMQGKKGIATDSFGNGGGMRVSPIGFHAKTLEEALEQARLSAIPSHDSVEGIKGAQSIAAATFLAKQQRPKEVIKAYIEKEFGYNLDRTDEEIAEFVSKLRHGDSKKGIPSEREFAENTCPLAIIAFLTTDDYESSIWKSISYGCDTDTVACMCGGIAAAYYGVPQDIINEVTDYLPHEILDIINEFDHTNLKNTRTTPKKYDRWGAALVYGSGSDNIVDEKGHVIDEGGYEARQHFGATLKVREGFRKCSYAIPSVGKTLDEIREAVDRFIEYAETHQEITFMVIEIGCKKAGYTPKDIAPMFERASNLPNVYLPKVFREVLDTWDDIDRNEEKEVGTIEEVKTNFELTEENKASKKEMLSIKSGELLDDLLKQ